MDVPVLLGLGANRRLRARVKIGIRARDRGDMGRYPRYGTILLSSTIPFFSNFQWHFYEIMYPRVLIQPSPIDRSQVWNNISVSLILEIHYQQLCRPHEWTISFVQFHPFEMQKSQRIFERLPRGNRILDEYLPCAGRTKYTWSSKDWYARVLILASFSIHYDRTTHLSLCTCLPTHIMLFFAAQPRQHLFMPV